MTDFQILNSVEHIGIRVVTTPGRAFGDGIHCCPAYTFEFRDLQSEFPILLQDTGEQGFIPVVLMGFLEGENLFLEDGRWNSTVVPSFMRKGPFLIAQNNAGDEPVNMMSIDMDSPRVGREEGEALFQPLGARTDYLMEMTSLLEYILSGAENTLAFTAMLEELALIETFTVDITLKDGSKNQLIGFYTINEERVRELTPEQLGALANQGFLMPLFMMLASLSNLRRMIDLKGQVEAVAA